MKTISLKLPDDVDARLEARAKAIGKSKSALTREALAKYLDGHRRLRGLVPRSGPRPRGPRERARRPRLEQETSARLRTVRRAVILDTGPLVALVDARDQDHGWTVDQWSQIEPPLITCESVISEACFLLAQTRTGGAPVLEMLARHVLSLPFRLEDHGRTVRALMRKYADVPMSLADACLVRLAEVTIHSTVLTLDRDFKVYRKHGRQVIPLIIPTLNAPSGPAGVMRETSRCAPLPA